MLIRIKVDNMIPYILYQLLPAPLISSAKLQFNQFLLRKYLLMAFSKIPKPRLAWVVLLLCYLVFLSNALALTLNVVTPNGGTINKYHWLIEEDANNHVTLGVIGTNLLY